jgi:ParB family transcriptional regulator, chromosome partitioning protein
LHPPVSPTGRVAAQRCASTQAKRIKTTNTAPTAEHGTTIFIPLNKLKEHPRNARKTPHSEAKAASIAVKGILQNLLVEPETNVEGEPTCFYLVSIGEGRRQAREAQGDQEDRTHPLRHRHGERRSGNQP